MTEGQIEYWKNLQNFKCDPDNVPDLPITDITTWNTLIIPKLIECGVVGMHQRLNGMAFVSNMRDLNMAYVI